MIKIALLADYPDVIPTLAQWFRHQWPDYYAERTFADIAQDFDVELNLNSLPLRLVAFADGQVVATVSLREQALKDLPEYTPGLGGLFVVEGYRNLGIATELVKAGMDVARQQGYKSLYAGTVAARGILEHLGWKLVKLVEHGDEQLGLYACQLQPLEEQR